ncbi:hypothetical protein GGTG_12403 [Gaeumannomyces tritici R3-111a-1]|uniref:Uncharacterized protein n=1 Tax=Gaeumannomyces tritici (strain R3-111a-1) TaxID=644352 RepID=J3PFX8_GAET3|nr:hypothetical protein GGTG_12403 [Gaeumannomyces tritici R3-111a-1]EJT70230.1 hypothetical protein GGTG_12403 [Gaeumannomyces tritici R3-111a-1]
MGFIATSPVSGRYCGNVRRLGAWLLACGGGGGGIAAAAAAAAAIDATAPILAGQVWLLRTNMLRSWTRQALSAEKFTFC